MSTDEEEGAFIARLLEINNNLNEENITLKNKNNILTADNMKLKRERNKLKDEITKLKELNKTTEQEPEKIVEGGIPKIEYEGKATEEQDDNGIMKIECVEVKAIERKDDKGDMKIENEGKAIETQDDNEIPKSEYVEGKTIETKDDNGLIENKSGKETQGIKNHKNITEKRGLVVICTHCTFDSAQNLVKRPGAFNDFTMMKNLWESFECKVVEFSDMQTSFYKNELTKAIETELENISGIKFFVFVLSTHGEMHEEADVKSTKHSSQHIFYTKDGQFGIHGLMENISKIEMLKTKPKIFVIQACRAKSGGVNVDLGHVIHVMRFSGFYSDETESGNDIGFYSDETKSRNDTTFFKMDKSRNVKTIFTGTSKEGTSNNILPIEDIPLCEESVLLFATTSGKFAFQTINGEKSGGLAIYALYTIMTEAQVGDKLHITDILTRVNYEVQNAQIVCMMEPGVPLTPNLVFTDEMTMLDCQQQLENHVNDLMQLCKICVSKEHNEYNDNIIRQYIPDLAVLRDKITNKNNTKDILLDLQNNLNEISDLLTACEKYIPIKCQSCFYHNLSIDTDDVYFEKVN